jgi:uncharacterized 2Fe-2S/4Fe-4S cluster protein (DUF4445 family)
MEHIVRIIERDRIIEGTASTGTNLLEYLLGSSINVISPCGGKGTCGKCMVRIKASEEIKPIKNEVSLLGKQLLEKGYRLACHHIIDRDIDVYIDRIDEDANIVTQGIEKNIQLKPLITKIYAEFEKPDINDQRSDLDRIASYSDQYSTNIPLKGLRTLPKLLRENDFKVTLLIEENKIIGIEPGNTNLVIATIIINDANVISAILQSIINSTDADTKTPFPPLKLK